MRMLNVPKSLRRPRLAYPPHNQSVGIEQFCHEYLKVWAFTIKTERVYLPIYWTNNYSHETRRLSHPGFHALDGVQRFVDSLNPNIPYATVVQCANGIYEQLPPNVLVFAAGGTGDIPIPLITNSHPAERLDRDLTACFVGTVNCDAGGPGSQIRQAMASTFSSDSRFYLKDQGFGSDRKGAEFRRALCRSLYGLAPRGYGLTSFRLYEAMQLGSVPVYIYSEPWLPYQDELDWQDFAVLCPASGIGALPERLLSIGGRQHRKFTRKIKQIWNRYFTLVGMARYIARKLDREG